MSVLAKEISARLKDKENLKQQGQYIEEIRTHVENLELAHEKSRVSEYVTLSLGVSTMLPRG